MAYITKQKMFHKEYICKESSSIWDINLKGVHPGSLAVVPEEKEIYILDVDYTWRKKSDGTELEKPKKKDFEVTLNSFSTMGNRSEFLYYEGIFYGLEPSPLTEDNYGDYDTITLYSLDNLSYDWKPDAGSHLIPVLNLYPAELYEAGETYHMGFGGYDYEAGHFYKSGQKYDYENIEISKEEFIEYLKTKAKYIDIYIDEGER